jgi:hypothetical protein
MGLQTYDIKNQFIVEQSSKVRNYQPNHQCNSTVANSMPDQQIGARDDDYSGAR